jgi:hypothetical protein
VPVNLEREVLGCGVLGFAGAAQGFDDRCRWLRLGRDSSAGEGDSGQDWVSEGYAHWLIRSPAMLRPSRAVRNRARSEADDQRFG